MEKTFVDFYLMGDYDRLINTYFNLGRLKDLNVFEKCLLIDSLVQSGRNAEAVKLAENIRISKEAFENISIERQNEIFDIVLNLNMLKDKETEFEGGIQDSSVASLSSTLLMERRESEDQYGFRGGIGGFRGGHGGANHHLGRRPAPRFQMEATNNRRSRVAKIVQESFDDYDDDEDKSVYSGRSYEDECE